MFEKFTTLGKVHWIKSVSYFALLVFFVTFFVPDILRQLERVNFQTNSETHLDIHKKCSFQILIITVMHEHILLKLAIINLYENLHSGYRVFYSRGGGVKETKKLISKLVWEDTKTDTRQRVVCQNSCFSLYLTWFWNMTSVLRDKLGVF